MKIRPVTLLVLLAAVLAIVAIIAFPPHSTKPGVRLLDAAERGELAVVKALIQEGVPINQTSPAKFGWTPLIGAIFHKQTNVADYLMESGADVNLADSNGVTPLMWAITWGDEALPLVKRLIARGADLNAKDKHGSTAFDCAKSEPPRPQVIDALQAARSKDNNPR